MKFFIEVTESEKIETRAGGTENHDVGGEPEGLRTKQEVATETRRRVGDTKCHVEKSKIKGSQNQLRTNTYDVGGQREVL